MNELTGAALDLAVAEIEGFNPKLEPIEHWLAREGAPVQDWRYGGPIIARERIDLRPIHRRPFIGTAWYGFCPPGVLTRGDTPLVAAMRAYVASKRTTDTEPQSGNEGGTAG